MPEIIKSGSDSGLFIYDGLEYNKGLFKIFYNSVELSGGVPDTSKVEVGIKYIKDDEVLATAVTFDDWIDGDKSLPFTSYTELVTYLSQALALTYTPSGGVGDASEVTLAKVEANTNNTGKYSQDTLTSVTPEVYAANTYKEISFVVEEGGVTVNDGTKDMVYLSTDKSIGYPFTGDRGIPQTITFTLDASSKVKVVTKAL